jgi:hypothetical protein
MKRLIAAFAAALMLAVVVPGVASAATIVVNVDADNPPLTTVVTNWENDGGVSPGEQIEVIDGDILVFEISNPNTFEPECFGSIILWNQNAEAATAKYSNGDSVPASEMSGGQMIAWTPDSEALGEGPVTITIPISGKMNPERSWAYEYGTLAVIEDDGGCAAGLDPIDWIVYPLVQGSPATDPLTTSTPTLKRNGISFTPDNFDPTCAYEISTTAGTTAAQNLYTGATLSKATWSVDPAWAGKSYSCTTTSYAAGAVGIANS